MNHIDFVEKNIRTVLQKDGLTGIALDQGIKAGIRAFKQTPSFKPGKCFDYCLQEAKLEAKRYQKMMQQQQQKDEAAAKKQANSQVKRASNERIRPAAH